MQIKDAIAEEKNAHTQFNPDKSNYGSLSDRKWESFTQGAGLLISPNFGPNGVNVTFDNTTDASFDEDESVRFRADNRGENTNGMSFGMDVMGKDFGNAMMSTRTGPRVLSAGPGHSRWGYQPR